MPNPTPSDYEQLAETAEARLNAGDLEQGIALLIQASTLAESAGDSVAQAALLNNLALAQQRAGQFADARETLIRAVDLLEGAGAPADSAQALHNLGFVERELGDLNAARRRHQAALNAFEAMGGGHANVATRPTAVPAWAMASLLSAHWPGPESRGEGDSQ